MSPFAPQEPRSFAKRKAAYEYRPFSDDARDWFLPHSQSLERAGKSNNDIIICPKVQKANGCIDKSMR
jgi:hypothetical protein